MTEKTGQDSTPGTGRGPGAPKDRGSRRRLGVSLLLLYLSMGFLLTFTMRWEWIMPDPGVTDFLDAMVNPRIYLSALTWPYWLIHSLL